jgi:Fic family protein
MSATTTPTGCYEQRIWTPDPGAYGGRRARKGGPYEVFIPAEVARAEFGFSAETATSISEASSELARLNAAPPRLVSLEALARNILRSEGVASSRIEGLAISHQRLARAHYSNRPGGDRRAAEVLGNVEALRAAIELGAKANPLRIEDVCEIHRTLLRFLGDETVAGVVRNSQSWIGGNDYNPIGAAYVPPPPEVVVPLLEDLVALIQRDDLPPIAQAAIAHAQFETIHPFADGNGRVGRALVYTVLRRRGDMLRFIPPISLVLARRTDVYIAGLVAYRDGDVDGWCANFADATTTASLEAERLASLIEQREAEWIDRLGHPRSDAASLQIIRALPAHPVLDVKAAQQITGKSHVAVGKALAQLEDKDILKRLNENKWGRLWECQELLDLVTDFEEALATPAR